MRKELEYENPLKYDLRNEKNPNHKNVYRLVINDEHLSHTLESLGVVDKKSLILTFPEFLRPDLIRHFVRGYFDGDGCVSYDYKYNKIRTNLVGTLEFVSAISNIMNAMFIKNYIHHPKQSCNSNTYVLATSANVSSYKFLSWIYQDCDMKMDRKYQRYLDFSKKYLQPDEIFVA